MLPGFLRACQVMNPEVMNTQRNLVIIQLSGGNDGLNTIIPYGDDLYYGKRPRLGVAPDKVLKLTHHMGLNPALRALHSHYEQGELAILNNVGYPNPDRSHFRAMDIWHTASHSNEILNTGWIGRYLDSSCEHSYEALQMGGSLSLAMKGKEKKAITLQNPGRLLQATRSPYFNTISEHTTPEMLSDDNMGYLYKTMVETHSSARYIFETSKIYSGKTVSYPRNGLASQLRETAKLICSGLETRIYYTDLSGFDTHVGQESRQAHLLQQYAESISAFVEELKANDRFKDTLILTFSEFGRRVEENASMGTDHGAASNVLLMGGNLKRAGFLNEPPDLANLSSDGDLKFTVDFRSVYATALENWLEVKDRSILNDRSFPLLDFV